MNLHHLCATPHVALYFDSWNEWLYLDWEGDLTLAAVQHSCLEIGRCFLSHPYPRVLNNNTGVTSITQDVPAWLADEFFPYMGLAGVTQMAWVSSPSLRGHFMAAETLKRLPHLDISLFGDVEEAVTWLQHAHPTSPGGDPPLPLPAGPTLAKAVRALSRHLTPPEQAAG